MTIVEKVAYIKGLAEGLAIDKESKEGKLFDAIIDVLDDIALTVADNCDQLDAIDEDLAAVEEIVYEEDDEDLFDDDYCTGDCSNCDGCDDFEYDEDEGVYEFECPHCHETVFFDDSLFEDEDYELACPACGAKIDSVFEFEDEEDGEE